MDTGHMYLYMCAPVFFSSQRLTENKHETDEERNREMGEVRTEKVIMEFACLENDWEQFNRFV